MINKIRDGYYLSLSIRNFSDVKTATIIDESIYYHSNMLQYYDVDLLQVCLGIDMYTNPNLFHKQACLETIKRGDLEQVYK